MKKVLMAETLEYESEFKVGSHHYAKLFSENGYKVLWLSPMYNFLIKIKNKKVYEQRKKLNRAEFVEIDKNIYGYSPYSLMLYGNVPLCKSKLSNKLSMDCTLPNIKKVLNNNNFFNVDILWITNPKYYYLIEFVKYKKLIYRCPDDLSQFKDCPKSLLEFEKKVIQKADKVYVTSINLLNKKKSIRDDIEYLPNGVDLNNFIRDKYVIPREFKDVKNKKCIYVGAIDYWFDLKLVKYCAEKLKNIEFYLIGPVRIDMRILSNLSNVHILGKRDYKEIPNYLYYSDVGIIPFKINKLTDSVAPIKLYEYMSVGLNVVSTKFKEISHIDSPAHLTSNKDEFNKFIVNAIGSKKEFKEKNKDYAKRNTWERRFEKLY